MWATTNYLGGGGGVGTLSAPQDWGGGGLERQEATGLGLGSHGGKF